MTITDETLLGENLGEPAVIAIDGTCTHCAERSDRCVCNAEPFYALQQLAVRSRAARLDFERAIVAQLEAGITYRQVAWQAGLSLGAVQAIEKKHR